MEKEWRGKKEGHVFNRKTKRRTTQIGHSIICATTAPHQVWDYPVSLSQWDTKYCYKYNGDGMDQWSNLFNDPEYWTGVLWPSFLPNYQQNSGGGSCKG